MFAPMFIFFDPVYDPMGFWFRDSSLPPWFAPPPRVRIGKSPEERRRGLHIVSEHPQISIKPTPFM
jgi:hypothetical protein